MSFWKNLELDKLRPPELICFDHAYSEYLSMKQLVTEKEELDFIAKLVEKEKDGSLSWNDLYYFALILAKHIPEDQLRSKIIRLRSDYQSIASAKEFAEYLASKPPDIQSPPDRSNPKMTDAEYEALLRGDLTDLLDRMFIKYEILPIREKRLTDLTMFAAKLCAYSMAALLAFLSVAFIVPLVNDVKLFGWDVFRQSGNLSALTIFAVVLTGTMGGFVSALQRIQSTPTEGDSLYNLSLLFHGYKSVYVAPITGAIFAMLLYFMFASGILKGTFFPDIFTPGGNYKVVSLDRRPRREPEGNANANRNSRDRTPEPANTASLANSKTPSPAAANPVTPPSQPGASSPAANTANFNARNGNAAAISPTTTPSLDSPSPSPEPKSSPEDETSTQNAPVVDTSDSRPVSVAEKGVSVFDFLARTGPSSGKDYALLIIWCFIAGFAERFVPDALDRLISNSKSNGKK